MATSREVADWMLEQLKREDTLHQESVVGDIEDKFGDEFVYENENGNLAISKGVLAEFRKLTGETVVWSRAERFWRFREDHDEPGRQQD